MELTQIVLLTSIVSITVLLVVVGFWLISILKELRLTVVKTNQILDDTKLITSSVAQPVSTFSEFVMGLKSGLAVFNNLFNRRSEVPESNKS